MQMVLGNSSDEEPSLVHTETQTEAMDVSESSPSPTDNLNVNIHPSTDQVIWCTIYLVDTAHFKPQ